MGGRDKFDRVFNEHELKYDNGNKSDSTNEPTSITDSIKSDAVDGKDSKDYSSKFYSRKSDYEKCIKKDDEIYTYDKAIQDYSNSMNLIKRRTASLSSLHADNINITSSNNVGKTITPQIGDRLNFFAREIDKEKAKDSAGGRKSYGVSLRKKPSIKVDVRKRRTMFEMSSSSVSTCNLSNIDNDCSLTKNENSDLTASTGCLKSRLASFERSEQSEERYNSKLNRAPAPRDTHFQEKLANFSTSQSSLSTEESITKTKPVKDMHFKKKLASFNHLENSVQHPSAVNRRISTNSLLKSKVHSFEQINSYDPPAKIKPKERTKYKTLGRDFSYNSESSNLKEKVITDTGWASCCNMLY